MKFTRLLYLLGISLVAAVGCNSEVSLDFHKEGNCWQMSQKQFERFAKKLSTAAPDEAYRLIDRVYTTVDSLTAAEQDGTFIVFSDAMEQTFYQVDSPLRDDELYLHILDREARCTSLMSTDYRRMDWKRHLLQANAVGSEVIDLPISDSNCDETSLHRLLDRQAVILIYGEDCKACTKLMEEAVNSSVLKKAASDDKLRLISLYIGENNDEFAAKSAVLKDWANYIDSRQLVRYENAFDSRLVPSLYLISDKKMVKVKGTLSVKEIEKALDAPAVYSTRIVLNEGEQVWGGRIADGKFMPYQDGFKTTFSQNSGNQIMPLLITSDGRYVWSDAPYDFHIDGNVLTVENALA